MDPDRQVHEVIRDSVTRELDSVFSSQALLENEEEMRKIRIQSSEEIERKALKRQRISNPPRHTLYEKIQKLVLTEKGVDLVWAEEPWIEIQKKLKQDNMNFRDSDVCQITEYVLDDLQDDALGSRLLSILSEFGDIDTFPKGNHEVEIYSYVNAFIEGMHEDGKFQRAISMDPEQFLQRIAANPHVFPNCRNENYQDLINTVRKSIRRSEYGIVKNRWQKRPTLESSLEEYRKILIEQAKRNTRVKFVYD